MSGDGSVGLAQRAMYKTMEQSLGDAETAFENVLAGFLLAHSAYHEAVLAESKSHRALVLSDKASNLSAAAFALQRAAYADAQKK